MAQFFGCFVVAGLAILFAWIVRTALKVPEAEKATRKMERGDDEHG